MNTKPSYILILAIWIRVASLGFAETFPSRMITSEWDQIVVLGKECINGLNERYLALRQAPPIVGTNADIGWYLDANMMGRIAATARSVVPNYVDTNTVYNGSSNITMLTVTGLWANLEIGNRTNEFTRTPAIGATPATYGDYPWPIFTLGLQERYKVIRALEKSSAPMERVWLEKWRGVGYGLTDAEAYQDAVANYTFQSFDTGLPFEQTCAIALWSNNIIAFQTYRSLSVSTNNAFEVIITNVSGFGGSARQGGPGVDWSDEAECLTDNNSDAWAIHTAEPPDYPGPGQTKYLEALNFGFNVPAEATIQGIQVDIKCQAPQAADRKLIVGIVSPVSGGTAEKDVSGGVATGAYTLVSLGGPNDLWGLDWTVNDINDAAFSCWTWGVVPEMDTQEFRVDFMKLIVTYVVSNALSAADNYCGEHPLWTGGGGWVAAYDESVNAYFITKNWSSTNPPHLPGFVKESSDNPVGTYVAMGGNYSGTVSAEYIDEGIYGTNHWNGNTVFYQCWLNKTVMTNNSYSSTNIEHRSSYWYYPVRPLPGVRVTRESGELHALPGQSEICSETVNFDWDDYYLSVDLPGETNYFDNQGENLRESIYTEKTPDPDIWTFDAYSAPVYFIGNVSDPPVKAAAPVSNNSSVTAGFILGDERVIKKWRFQYAPK